MGEGGTLVPKVPPTLALSLNVDTTYTKHNRQGGRRGGGGGGGGEGEGGGGGADTQWVPKVQGTTNRICTTFNNNSNLINSVMFKTLHSLTNCTYNYVQSPTSTCIHSDPKVVQNIQFKFTLYNYICMTDIDTFCSLSRTVPAYIRNIRHL